MDHLITQPRDADFDNNLELGNSPDKDRVGWLTDMDERREATTAVARPYRNANRNDERFLRQEKMIRRGLDRALAGRRIGLKTSELCQELNIARSTFHAHYRSCDEALVWYELELEEEFVRSLPQNVRRDLAFTLLLNFVSKYRHYFASAFQGQNMYLLAKLVKHACVPVADLNRRAYILYTCSVSAMIWCWGKCDKFSEGKMEVYRKKLLLLRVMDYGL